MTEPRLVDLYAHESEEAFEQLLARLLDLEDPSRSPEERRRLQREVMSLLHGAKGGAMVVPGFASVGSLLHAAESRVARLDGGQPLAKGDAGPIIEAIDACRRIVQAACRDEAPPDASAILAALEGDAAPPPATPSVPSEPASAATDDAATPAAGLASIRVPVADVDALVSALGELTSWRGVLARRRVELEEASALLAGDVRPESRPVRDRLERLARSLGQDERALARTLRRAVDGAERFRLQPCGTVLEALRRACRDVAQRTGKHVQFVAGGADALLDRRALDSLKAPLIHLVRNAVDHGIEPPEERTAAGKAALASVRVSVSRASAGARIEVADDGRGLDEAALRERGVALGIPAAETRPLAELLGVPGLSTRSVADEISGRGTGVSAVRDAVGRLGGHLAVETRPGAGTTFAVCLPPTFATRRGLLVGVRDRSFYVPVEFVERLLRVRREGLVIIDGRPGVAVSGSTVPVLDVARVLGVAGEPREGFRPLVLVRAGLVRAALAVDAILGQHEILPRPLRWPLVDVRAIEGVAVEADGAVVPVLSVPRLLRSDLGERAADVAEPRRERRPRVLIVDDSVTTRSLERSVLEGAGFDVTAASDGRDALATLEGAERFDLVISDVEMPRLDGIGLVEELRKTHPKSELPILLVTSVERDAVRVRGMDAGANALLLKQTFDPESLLAMVRALLAGAATASGAEA